MQLAKMSFNFVETDARPSPVDPNKTFLPQGEVEVSSTRRGSIFLKGVVDDYTEGRRFRETSEQALDKYEYPRDGSDPGLVVIFNQQTFDDPDHKVRSGTNRDVNELIVTFGRLGYNIEKENIHNNFKKQEILDELRKLSKEDYSNRNSLIIVVLTHGDQNNILQARDKPLYTYDVWGPFSEGICESFRNKPKFFIFQACKGQGYSNPESSQSEIVPSVVYKTPMEPNMLVAFSAVEGNQSYRHKYNGTWFIQELCKNFTAFGRRDDVVSLLIRTTKCVAHSYYVHPGDGSNTVADSTAKETVQKQMPLFISTLTKKFYLTRSKDRNLMLHILQQQQIIIDTLNFLADPHKRMEEMRKQKRK